MTDTRLTEVADELLNAGVATLDQALVVAHQTRDMDKRAELIEAGRFLDRLGFFPPKRATKIERSMTP